MIMARFILVLLLVATPACTTLDVKVEIFNPSGITSEVALESTVKREAASHAYLLRTDFYPRGATDLKEQVTAFLTYLASVQCPDKSKVIADGDLPRITSTGKSNVEKAIGETVKARNEGMTVMRQAETVKKEERGGVVEFGS